MSWSFTYSDAGSTILNTATPTTGAPSVVEIPDTVVEIRDGSSNTTGVFYNKSQITSIVFPNTLKKIGNYAFVNCTNLSSVYGLSSISTIGSYSFYYCTKLSTLNNGSLTNTLPSTIRHIGTYSFFNTALRYFSTLGQLSTIDSNVYYASGISTLSLQVDPYVSTIPASAFYAMPRLSTFTINNNPQNTLPSSISSIGASAFAGCGAIQNITIPGQIEVFATNVFSGTRISSLSLNINPTISTLWTSAFYGATYLSTFFINNGPANTLPSSISSISGSAFYNCMALQNIYMSGKLSRIDTYAFFRTPISSLSMQFDPSYSSISAYAFAGMANLSTFVINDGPLNTLPSSVTSIGTYAFNNCTALTYLSTSGYLTLISSFALTGTSISSLNLRYASSVNAIGSTIFGSVSTLSTFIINDGPLNTFPSTMTIINAYSLQNMPGLTYISTFGDITSIGSQPFMYSNISSISIRFNSSLSTIPQWAFSNTIRLSTLVINDSPPNTLPSSVTGLSNNAFLNCPMTSLSTLGELVVFGQGAAGIFGSSGISSMSLRFSSTLVSIPGSAFLNANKLSSLVINNGPPNTVPSSIISIGNAAFSLCSALTYLSTLGNISSFGTSPFAFSGFSTLSLRFNASLSTLPPSLFTNASSLSTFYINDGLANTLPSTINSISSSVFAGCSSIQYISTAGQLRSISANAFSDSFISSMSLQFSTTMSTLDSGAFANATQLSLLYINNGPANMLPSSITSIGSNAFSTCTSLKYISTAGQLRSLASNAFTNSYISSMSLQCSSIFSSVSAAAFYGATNLSTFTINDLPPNTLPSSVVLLNTNAFTDCKGLLYLSTLGRFDTFNGTSIFAGSGILSLSMIFNSTIGFLPTGASFITNATNLSTFVINGGPPNTLPSSISSIRAGFANCVGLKYLSTLAQTEFRSNAIAGSGISSIALQYLSTPTFVSGLNGATELRSVYINGGPENTFPSTIVSVSDFTGCSSIKYLNMQGDITSFGLNVFENCIGLSSISFGLSTSLTTLPLAIFSNCSSLKNININGQTNIFPSTVTAISANAFMNCSNLSTIKFNGSLTTIGASTFYNCINLTSTLINLSTPLITLPPAMFSNCSSLKNININGLDNVLPSTVTSIGADALINCSSLTSLIAYGIMTSIGSNCFNNCSRLTNLQLSTSPSLITLSDGLFTNCRNLYNIVINGENNIFPSTVTSIGSNVFNNCVSLNRIGLNGNLTSIGASSFSNCINISSISFGLSNSATSLPNALFMNCGLMRGIIVNNEENTFPSTITTIGTSVFTNCSSIKNIAFNGNLNSIGTSSFTNCTKLSSISFGTGTITLLSDSLFTECRSLQNIYINSQLNTFPSTITTIGTSVFTNCQYISSLTIPGPLINIGASTFMNMIRLRNLNLNLDPLYTTISSALFYNIGGSYSLLDLRINGEINTFPSTVRHIQDNSFRYTTFKSSNLTFNGEIITLLNSAFLGSQNINTISLNLSSSVSTISSNTFASITSLSTIVINGQINTIPSSIVNIDNSAFANSGLESLTIPGRLQRLSEYAFQETKLKEITINVESTLTTLPSSLFNNCSNLSTIIINGEKNIVPSSIEYISSSVFYGTKLASLKLNGNLKYIGSSAFSNTIISTIECIFDPSMTKLENSAFSIASLSSLIVNSEVNIIPSSIIDIGNGTFANTSLTYLKLNGSLINIGSSAFDIQNNMSSLHLYFNSSMSTINYNTFSRLFALKSLVINDKINRIPSTITEIGMRAFSNCWSFESLVFEGQIRKLDKEVFANLAPIYSMIDSKLKFISLDLDLSVSTLQNSLFSYCESLSTIRINGRDNIIPSTITNVMGYCFSNCSSIRALKIEGTLQSLGSHCFNGCTNISSLYLNIDTTIESIAENVFTNCSRLSTITINGIDNTVPESIYSIETMAFSGCSTLSKIILPSQLNTIALGAFDGCNEIFNYFRRELIKPTIQQDILHTMLSMIYLYDTSTIIVSDNNTINNFKSHKILSHQSHISTNAYDNILISTTGIKLNSFSSNTVDYEVLEISVNSNISDRSSIITINANKYNSLYDKHESAYTFQNTGIDTYDTVLFSLDRDYNKPITIIHKDDRGIETVVGRFDITNAIQGTTNILTADISITVESITDKDYNIKYIGPFSETIFQIINSVQDVSSTNSSNDCSLAPYNATNFTPANSAVFNTLVSYAKTQPQYPWPTGSDAQQIYRSRQNITYFNAMNQQAAAAKNSAAKQYPQFKTQTERLMYLQGMTLTAARNQITGQNPSAPAGVPCSTIYQIINS